MITPLRVGVSHTADVKFEGASEAVRKTQILPDPGNRVMGYAVAKEYGGKKNVPICISIVGPNKGKIVGTLFNRDESFLAVHQNCSMWVQRPGEELDRTMLVNQFQRFEKLPQKVEYETEQKNDPFTRQPSGFYHVLFRDPAAVLTGFNVRDDIVQGKVNPNLQEFFLVAKDERELSRKFGEAFGRLPVCYDRRWKETLLDLLSDPNTGKNFDIEGFRPIQALECYGMVGVHVPYSVRVICDLITTLFNKGALDMTTLEERKQEDQEQLEEAV